MSAEPKHKLDDPYLNKARFKVEKVRTFSKIFSLFSLPYFFGGSNG